MGSACIIFHNSMHIHSNFKVRSSTESWENFKRFKSGYSISWSYHQSMNFPLSFPAFGAVTIFFLILALLIGVQGYIIVVLIYISLTSNDIKHLFLCLFATCITFFTEMSHHVFCSSSKWIICFRLVLWVLYIFWVLDLCQLSDLQMFFPTL